jgi:biofilm protein TabA
MVEERGNSGVIIGDLSKWKQEQWAFAVILRKAIDHLESTDFMHKAIGRYDLLGDDMYVMVQKVTTVPPKERKAENHRQYIDVQMVVTGEELHVVARQSERNQPVENEITNKDYALYQEVENEFELNLKPGMFVVYFPDDVHRPACSRSGGMETKRVVIKINKALLHD